MFILVNMEKFLDLSVGQIPTFHGIKYTSNDLSDGYNAIKAANGRYAVFLGADTVVKKCVKNTYIHSNCRIPPNDIL